MHQYLFVAMPVTSTLHLILEEEGSALGVAVDFLAMVIVAALLLFVIPLPPRRVSAWAVFILSWMAG